MREYFINHILLIIFDRYEPLISDSLDPKMFVFSSHIKSFINLIVQVILLSIPPSVSLVGDRH